ncbi:RHS repeat-associated core domain-containing protein [Aestuariibacter sp. AA17]|uniref:RHS repeat-associated core domain-containing protein n=1 Tax=Fluctibacter corallii TaxID=2984329 RepID=A0ABT3AAZ2_9ALTE|nr:RHS repeat-associated core domain-containing protein [Aestuariibacter sp. AA17]MCV2885755.1 RHS repeat-associated core domain-containing protein [Aestuariibacter sp. AA17]
MDDIGYTGHKFDTDIGLSYMQVRYYDPVIGRFYSNDPVDSLGHMLRSNPIQGFGRYTYANNNPYKYVDPDGEAGVLGFIAGVGLEITRQALTGELKDTSLSGIAKNAGKALVSGFAGATGAGLATKTAQLGNVLRVTANTAAGGAIGATSTVANNAIDGNNLTDNVGVGTVLGAAGGAAGTIVGDAIDAGTAALKQKAFNATSVADQNLTQHIKGATGGGASSTSVGVGDVLGNVASNAAGVADSCGVKDQC